MSARIQITLNDRRQVSIQKRDYEGFITRPMTWETSIKKFEQLSQDRASTKQQHNIDNAVANLENIQVSELVRMLEKMK